jgi:hypothetical protein
MPSIAAKGAVGRREAAAKSQTFLEQGALTTGQVFQHRLVGLAQGGERDGGVGGFGAGESGKQLAGDLRLDIPPLRERMIGQAGHGLCRQLHAGKGVEQLGVAHHAAHGHGAVVANLVDGGGLGLGLHRRGGNVPAHGMAGDENLLRGAQCTAVLRRNLGEGLGQRIGVFHAGTHVVEVFAVTRGSPGIPVLDQVAANARVLHEQVGALARIAVGIHHQLAVPVLGHFDVVGRSVEHPGPAAGAGHGHVVTVGGLHGLEAGGRAGDGKAARVLDAIFFRQHGNGV